MTSETSGSGEHDEEQLLPSWGELAERAVDITERSPEPRAVHDDISSVSWTDEGTGAAVTLPRFGDDFEFSARDALGKRYLDVLFNAKGAEPEDIDVSGILTYDTVYGKDASAAARREIRDLVRDGPGSERYEQRHSEAVGNVWEAVMALPTDRRQVTVGDVALRQFVQEPAGMVGLDSVSVSVPIVNRSVEQVAQGEDIHMIRRLEFVVGGEAGQPPAIIPTLSTRTQRYQEGRPSRTELTERSLQLDGTLLTRDIGSGGRGYSRDPFVIQEMADQLTDMRLRQQSDAGRPE